MNLSLDKFRDSFIAESYEHLEEMEQLLVGLNTEAADSEQLNAIFRCAHSIKGGAGSFGLQAIASFTHVLEALLDVMREGAMEPTPLVVDALLRSVDVVRQMVDAAKVGQTPASDFGSELLAELQSFVSNESQQTTAVPKTADEHSAVLRTWVIQFTPDKELFDSGNEPIYILRELSGLGEAQITVQVDKIPLLEDLDPLQGYLNWSITLLTDKSEQDINEVFEFVEGLCALTIKEIVTEPEENTAVEQTKTVNPAKTASAAEAAPTKPHTGVSSIRIDIDKVDRLVNIIGELVITEAMIKAQTRDFSVEQFAALVRGVDELSQHTRELQEAVMSVRMQPVKSVFSRMPRIVHDISLQLGKKIHLQMSGENTEVDKTVIEQLSDPLTHIIRNCCDHGIESPEVRLASGKPVEGTIFLSAEHRGGQIIIEIKDDGAGINRDRVLAKAHEKNLINDEMILADEEIDNLIFMAGFSTAEQITNISGRGVGLDVVKRNIEGIGGSVKLINNLAAGSSFVIALPLTMAILDGMIVRVGNENYIIPISNIIETLRPLANQVKPVEEHHDVMNVRGEFIEVVYLYEILGIANAIHDASKALVVLIESGERKIGLVVDELIGQQQVVIKSLEANADPVKGISGATILGDGRVSLILDINELTNRNPCKAEYAA